MRHEEDGQDQRLRKIGRGQSMRGLVYHPEVRMQCRATEKVKWCLPLPGMTVCLLKQGMGLESDAGNALQTKRTRTLRPWQSWKEAAYEDGNGGCPGAKDRSSLNSYCPGPHPDATLRPQWWTFASPNCFLSLERPLSWAAGRQLDLPDPAWPHLLQGPLHRAFFLPP